MAVKVAEIEGRAALLQQQVSTGLGNVSSQLAAMQGDLREVEKVVQTIALGQHEIQSHSTGLDRLAKVIERHVEQQDVRWRAHETDNKGVADRVTMWRGVIIGFGAIATLLTAAAVYFVQYGFDVAYRDRTRIESTLNAAAKDTDARLDALEARR